ncbi:MAG: hypothetical protein ACI8ZM_001384 [Crocinitomix sp.]|jgi:hypothetical protein
MKNLKYCLLATGILLLSFSCKKETSIEPTVDEETDSTTTIITDPTGTIEIISGVEVGLGTFFTENLAAATQHHSFDVSSGLYYGGAKGTYLSMPANNLKYSDGAMVTGMVDLALIEIDRRSEMVILNKATTGMKPDGSHTALTSNGEFYIRMSQDGEDLTLIDPLVVESYTFGFDPEMRKFVNTSETEDLLWEIAFDSIVGEGDELGSQFFLSGNDWGWINLDKFADYPGLKTNIYAELPDGLNLATAEVYVAFDGEMTTLTQLNQWEDGKFAENYGTIPIGLEVHFIAIYSTGGQLHYNITPATITENHVAIMSDFTEIEVDDLSTIIDDLP